MLSSNLGVAPSPHISVRCVLDADEVSESSPAYLAQYGFAPAMAVA